jgi:type II secretory ATPase GspE/PulE/Tfp pilus assembly ATPase PilB-like protein
MLTSNTVASLRRSLLIKVVCPLSPSRPDITGVIESTAARLIEVLQAQSMAFYIVDGNQIAFIQACYSPSLWTGDPDKERWFRQTAAELLSLKIPLGRGIVGKVIETGEPEFFRNAEWPAPFVASMAQTKGFEVQSMLTVPLKTSVMLGAMEILNKEVAPGLIAEFTDEDLELLQEFAEYIATLIHRMVDPNIQLSPDDAARFIARLTALPLVKSPDELVVDKALVASVGEEIIRREAIFPYKLLSPNTVAVVMTNPLDHPRKERFAEAMSMTIDEVSVVSPIILDALVQRYFPAGSQGSSGVGELNVDAVADAINQVYASAKDGEGGHELETQDSAPIIQLTNRLIEDAYVCGASDIHIEPGEKMLFVRYRVDGACQEKLLLPKRATAAIVARIKIMCNLDIAETRLPQDGRIIFKRYTKKNIDVDLRVAVCPTNYGEKVVMRILDKTKTALPLSDLGFSDENLTKYRQCIRQPYGMILHCGPTGSGKSMTLYSALGEVNTRDMNIQTAEDPIEYTLPGLNQTQMNRQIGLTFARALRSYLRMDPDIILVGEIRDQETAQIAVEAALTGHLLVSTLHTNDAASTVARLAEMGVEPFNISASLVCVCAQRLLRRVCKNCKIPYEPRGREAEILVKATGGTQPIFKANPEGCPICNGAGYKGRVGIHELLINDEDLTDAINKGSEAAELKRIAMRGGMKTLHQDSMAKVRTGITTIEEALANVPPDFILAHGTTSPIAQCA